MPTPKKLFIGWEVLYFTSGKVDSQSCSSKSVIHF